MPVLCHFWLHQKCSTQPQAVDHKTDQLKHRFDQAKSLLRHWDLFTQKSDKGLRKSDG